MLLGYHTSGFTHHDPFQAIELLATIGYKSVAITLTHGPLNPLAADWPHQLTRLKELLKRLGLRSSLESSAPYLLDPRWRDQPSLISPTDDERQRRIDFLLAAIDAAAYLESDCVTLSSGVRTDDAADEAMFERLAEALRVALRHATHNGVTLGFEPEPGMFIDTLKSFHRLLQWIDAPHLELTLDAAHLWCQGELPIADYIARWSQRIVNVHVSDMRAGHHEHLMFGEGEMRFAPIIDALAKAGYRGAVHVELDRHSHMAPETAQKAFDFLNPLIQKTATM